MRKWVFRNYMNELVQKKIKDRGTSLLIRLVVVKV